MKISFFVYLFTLFLLTQQNSSGCDIAHSFRLITRMSGKSLYVNPNVNLAYIDDSNTDVWALCYPNANANSYLKNIKSSKYLFYNTSSQTISLSLQPITMVELDEGNSVPGYTLIKVYCPTNNFILSYEADLLNLSNYSNNELWAQWNKQPLNYIFGEENNSDVQYYPPNDCNTSFALKNKASELYLSFGNVYPYDGIITSHYGYANWLVSNNCSERIKDFESKQWVYCDGLLRTKYKLPADDASSGRYYYIINDSIRPTSGFAMALSDNSIQVTKPAYLEKVDGNVYIRYEIKGDSGSGPNPGIYYFYENSDTCGGYIFQLFLNLVDDHFKWIVEPDLTKIQA